MGTANAKPGFMTIQARDLMHTDVMTVSPDSSLLEVHRLFLEEEISGAPVVDDAGNLLGVISSMDLLRAVKDEYEAGAGSSAPFYLRDDLPYSGPDWLREPDDFQDRLAQKTASDAMVREIISVPPSASLSQVAALMRNQHVHRVLVIDGKALIGIVTTFDLLAPLEDLSAEPSLRPSL